MGSDEPDQPDQRARRIATIVEVDQKMRIAELALESASSVEEISQLERINQELYDKVSVFLPNVVMRVALGDPDAARELKALHTLVNRGAMLSERLKRTRIGMQGLGRMSFVNPAVEEVFQHHVMDPSRRSRWDPIYGTIPETSQRSAAKFQYRFAEPIKFMKNLPAMPQHSGRTWSFRLPGSQMHVVGRVLDDGSIFPTSVVRYPHTEDVDLLKLAKSGSGLGADPPDIVHPFPIKYLFSATEIGPEDLKKLEAYSESNRGVIGAHLLGVAETLLKEGKGIFWVDQLLRASIRASLETLKAPNLHPYEEVVARKALENAFIFIKTRKEALQKSRTFPGGLFGLGFLGSIRQSDLPDPLENFRIIERPEVVPMNPEFARILMGASVIDPDEDFATERIVRADRMIIEARKLANSGKWLDANKTLFGAILLAQTIKSDPQSADEERQATVILEAIPGEKEELRSYYKDWATVENIHRARKGLSPLPGGWDLSIFP